MDCLELFQERGFVSQTSNEKGVRAILSTPGAAVYEGFDPSSDSLHLGHLISLMAMHHLQQAGLKVIFLLGGATGLIGDPTGKKSSRIMLTPEIVAGNGAAMRTQVEKMGLIKFSGDNPALMVNNYDWIEPKSFLGDFMIKIARHFSVNVMVKMRTFAERLKDDKNLSLLEFLYPTLQAWDFLHLFEQQQCVLQIGGDDQWANILGGIELVQHVHQEEVCGLTFPLLTTSDGVKMGKTEKGVISLDPKQTTPFEFFQYLIKTPDELLGQMLRLLTFLPLEQIEAIQDDPRLCQRTAAFEITKIVHGEDVARAIRQDAETIFVRGEDTAKTVPVFAIPAEGMTLQNILIKSGSVPSNNQVRHRCASGAVRISDKKITDPTTLITASCLIRFGKTNFLRVEKKE